MISLRNIFCIIFAFLAVQSSAYAYGNQNLFLNTNHTYLLNFNEKILKVSIGSKEAVETELVTNLFNDKHQIIIKPVKASDTNIIVWTKNGLYNFDIYIDKTDKQSAKIIEFEKKNEQDLLDKPPVLEKTPVFNMELDKPPVLEKTLLEKNGVVIND